ncbi:MAG: HD domain-containing phosphohydrolase [Thermodesulfobacteriota bacterium]
MRRRRRRKADALQKTIHNFLFQLRTIVTNSRLLGPRHDSVIEMTNSAYGDLSKILRGRGELILMVIDDDLVINNKAIRAEEAKHFGLLITILKQKGISHLAFKSGLKKKDLTLLLADLASPGDKISKGSDSIVYGNLNLKDQTGKVNAAAVTTLSDKGQEIFNKLQLLSNEQTVLLEELYFSIQKNSSCDLRGVQKVIASFVNCFSENLSPLSMLATLKDENEYTFTHVVNVCILTLAQAESLGFRGRHLYDIGIVATLHDIGKTFIPDEILNKAGKLDENERKVINGHSTKGAHYVTTLENIPILAPLVALEHHIDYDGKGGYPNLGSNWKTHIVSQMVTIADVFDAMRSRRCYHRASSSEIVFNTLRSGKGSKFNPLLVENFIKVMTRHDQ